MMYNTVINDIIHGLCDSRCIIDGYCSKYYPRELREETIILSDGYPYYKQRNDGKKIMRSNETVDNRFVVPYWVIRMSNS